MKKNILCVVFICALILGTGTFVTVKASTATYTRNGDNVYTSLGMTKLKSTVTRTTSGNKKWSSTSSATTGISNLKQIATSNYNTYATDTTAGFHYNVMVTLNSYASATGSIEHQYKYNISTNKISFVN